MKTIIDFYADWCGPCKLMSPIVDKLNTKYPGQIKKINIDNDVEDKTKDYVVMSIPTFIVLNKDGEEVKRFTGLVDNDVLENELMTNT